MLFYVLPYYLYSSFYRYLWKNNLLYISVTRTGTYLNIIFFFASSKKSSTESSAEPAESAAGEPTKPEQKSTSQPTASAISLKIKSFSDLKATLESGKSKAGEAAHWTKVEGQPIEEPGIL